MSDNRETPLIEADRVRVPRRSQEAEMSDNREAPLIEADRVRVSRVVQEAR